MVSGLDREEGESDELKEIIDLWRKDIVAFVKDLSFSVQMVGVAGVRGIALGALSLLMVALLAILCVPLSQPLGLLLFIIVSAAALFWVYDSVRLLRRYRFLKDKYRPLEERASALER